MICMAAVMLAAFDLWAVNDYGSKYWTPTDEVTTPHIKWDKPDAQGPLKVFFIVSRLGMREVVELAQRMDLQYTVFAVGGQNYNFNRFNDFAAVNKYEPDRARDEDAMTDDIEAKLDGSYDLIALGNVNLNSFPLSVRYKLLKKVKDGTPLIGFLNPADEYFKQATAKKEKLDLPALIPYKALPAFAKYKDGTDWRNATMELATFGRGRILTLKRYQVPPSLQAFTPGPEGNLLEPKLVEYDYYLAWIVQLMRFMSGRTTVLVAGEDHLIGMRGEMTNLAYSVSGPEGKAATCKFIFRNDENDVLDTREKEIKLSAGGTTVNFDVPRSPGGRYFADMWVKEGEKILAFSSSFVELNPDPMIAEIEIQNDFRQEEKVAGKVKISARQATGNQRLVVRQRDTYGRITAETQVEIPSLPANAAQEINFTLSGGKPLTIMQYLEAELCQGREIQDRKRKSFSISDLPPKEDIRLLHLMEKWSESYPGYYMFAELATAGFDTEYIWFSKIPFLYNMRNMSYTQRLVDKKTDHVGTPSREINDHVRQPCLTDPEYRKQLADILVKKTEEGRPFSTVEFSMGDECRFVNGSFELCFSPTCVAAFHKFLAEEYGTVKAMNREYGTMYTSFDEVQPITIDKAKKEKNLQPLWIDYRRHMESTWAEIFSYCEEIVRKNIPPAKVGYEGSDTLINSFQGADFYKLMRAMRMNGTYDGAFVPYAVMSFARPGTLLGLGWYGGYNSTRCPEFQRHIAWRHLFRGANSYWIYTADARGQQSVMAPDMSFYDFFKANLAEIKEIQNGIGKLLMMSKRADDGIAILYSASSVHAATLTEGLPSMQNVLNALTPLFEDTGRQFRIISYEELAKGALKHGGFRLLWLPYAQALSRQEAAEIESFVKGGGTVIADIRPGVRDEHGKPYEAGGILDNVFGVMQSTSTPVATNCDAVINLNGRAKTLKNVPCDWSLGLRSGQANATLGNGTAVVDCKNLGMIINQYGKGRAILLNFSLSAYAGVMGALETSAVKTSDDAQEMREVFNILLAQAGMEPAVRIEPETNGVRLYRFVVDGMVYLGVLQELPESAAAYEAGEAKPLVAKPYVLKFEGKRHVYDIRAGKYLGCSDRIEVMIEPAKGMMYAFLPYEVKGLKLNAPKRVGQGEKLEYEVTLEGADHPGRHIFRMELVAPKGEVVAYYSDNMVGENGTGKGSVTLALNEMAGEWKIRARDVATGVTAERAFVVEELKGE